MWILNELLNEKVEILKYFYVWINDLWKQFIDAKSMIRNIRYLKEDDIDKAINIIDDYFWDKIPKWNKLQEDLLKIMILTK